MDIKSIENFLRSVAPFHLLPREAVHEIAELSKLRRYPQRELIFLEGEPAESGYLVFSGRVAMLKTSPNGKELIIELVPAGSFFGIVAFMDTKPYPLTARAQIDTVVLAFARSVVAPLLARFPDVQRGFVSIITDRMQGTQNLARALAHDCVESRVVALILALIPSSAITECEHGKAPELSISRQEIADLTGITLESASRAVKGLEREGLLDASHVGMIIVPKVSALRQRLQ